MTRMLEFLDALLRCTGVVEQSIQVGSHRQTGGFGDLGDQAARVILPAVLGDYADVPNLEQRAQLGWQLARRYIHDFETFDERRH